MTSAATSQQMSPKQMAFGDVDRELNVTRRVQHSGQEDSWTPAKRASASFLAQSGHLVGLTDLQRGWPIQPGV